MKRCICLLLVFSLLISMTGCSAYYDPEEIKENIKEAIREKLQEMFQELLDEIKSIPGKIFGGIRDWFKGLFTKKDKEPAETTQTTEIPGSSPNFSETIPQSSEIPQNTTESTLETIQQVPETTQTIEAKVQYETETDDFYDYCITVAPNNVDVRIVKQDGLKNVYLVNRKMDLETFKKFGHGMNYSDEEFAVLLVLYKAQDIGPEMLQMIQSIQTGQDPFSGQENQKKKDLSATDYIKSAKLWVDISFAFSKNDPNMKNGISKEEFLEECLGSTAKNIVNAGEKVEKIWGLAKIAGSAYELSKEYNPDSKNVDFTKKNTLIMLDAAGTLIGMVPTPPILGNIVKTQLKCLKNSCEMYFDGCANRVMFYKLTDDLVDQKNLAVEDVFKIDSTGRDPEWSFFMRVFNGGDVRECWGAGHMPSLAEVIQKLSQPVGMGTRYDQIGIEDALYGTSYQHMLAKYMEFRIHYEFENLTGVSLQYYYDLIKPQKKWGKKLAPWEKKLKPGKYPFFNPVMTSEDVKIAF